MVKKGSFISAPLIIYARGNNCENSYFIWHISDNYLDIALKNSQEAIEEIKITFQSITQEQ